MNARRLVLPALFLPFVRGRRAGAAGRSRSRTRLLVRPVRAMACAILMMASAAAPGSHTAVREPGDAERSSWGVTTNPRQLRAMQLLDRRKAGVAPRVRFEWDAVAGARAVRADGSLDEPTVVGNSVGGASRDTRRTRACGSRAASRSRCRSPRELIRGRSSRCSVRTNTAISTIRRRCHSTFDDTSVITGYSLLFTHRHFSKSSI